jgi:hypothetical protein
MARPSQEDLEKLAALERSVRERLAEADENPAAVLAAGDAVLAFAQVEERLFFPILPLLDPLVRAELEREHEQLADDLQLLQSLFTANPDCPDAAALAPPLAKRLRLHLARDARLIAHALRLGTRLTQAS